MTITKVDFDPDKKSIQDIFEGSTRMLIPRYQRTYAWTVDKVEEFYDDFIIDSAKEEDNLAYLGTIIFSKDHDGNLEVIDGQQRLVTITIFFSAMRDLVKNFIGTDIAKNYASQLQRFISIETFFGSSFLDNKQSDSVKLRVGTDIEKLFGYMIYNEANDASLVTPHKPAERNVINAYNLFYGRVKKSIDHPKITPDDQLKLVIRLVQKILSIEYIDIRVADNEVAYNLFESHNAKGVALAKTDLIKNYYFGRLKGTEDDKNKKMDEWDFLLGSLDEKTSGMLPDRFFNYMIESYEGHFSSSILYRKIKPYIQNPVEFYKILKSNINYMIELKTSNTEDVSVDIALSGIDKMKVNQCFIFLLSLYRNRMYLNQKNYQKIVELIEKFTYIYSAISKQPTNSLEKIYSKHAKRLQDEVNDLCDSAKDNSIEKEKLGGRLLNLLRADFTEILPTFATFSEGMANLSYDISSQKALIKYTFEKMENYYSNGMVSLSFQVTLDHIVPKNKSNQKGVYDSIGNLVPLSAFDNSSLGDKDPYQKLNTYKNNSNIYSVSGVVDVLEKQSSYGKKEIDDRINSLAEYAYNKVFSIQK